MSKPKVYIAGPMTGYVNYNRDAFHRAAQHLRHHGFDPVNPAAEDEKDGVDFTGWQHADYMRRDIALLLDCQFIYLLPGWRWSKGASLEAQVAKGCGIGELTDAYPGIWRTFEGEPEIKGEALRYEITDLGKEALEAVDLPAKYVLGAARSATGDEDLADHPRFGPAFEKAEPCTSEAVMFREFGLAGAAEQMSDRLFGDIGFVVDDSMPERTLRIEYPGGQYIDFEVIEDDRHGIRLERKRPEQPLVGEVNVFVPEDRPQPGDEFPNVGYVRRFKALLGLDRTHNEGSRRSA